MNLADFLNKRRTWWISLSPVQKYAPALLILLHWFIIFLLGGFERNAWNVFQYLLFGGLVLSLAYTNAKSRKILNYLIPLALVGAVYDSQYYWRDLIRSKIYVAEPYLFEKAWFGIGSGSERFILPEWFEINNHPLLDALAGFVYLLYVPAVIIVAAVFVFHTAKKGTKKRTAEFVRLRAGRVIWAFFVVNLLGWITWYVYPAAPPWYVQMYGLGPADPSTIGHPAGLARFDTLFGVNLFREFYSYAENVFGAIPSLHCGYAFLVYYYTKYFGALRITGLIYFLLMCFSAVYLNHHYVIDVVIGVIYGFIACYLTEIISERWMSQKQPALLKTQNTAEVGN